jgi:peptidoglycan/LPS O-acetylase OafA/YrhL
VTEQPWGTLGQRAARLVVPYWFALGLTIAASHLASLCMDHPSLSPPPGVLELALNLLLLPQIAGRESLSAGAWYVAIDLQLFALTLASLLFARGARHLGWTSRAQRGLGLGLLSSLTVAALFVFNLDAELDAWAPYFMGAYGLGMAAWWFSQPGQSRSWFVATLLVASLALSWAWRDRLVVAMVTAAALCIWRRHTDRAAARTGTQRPSARTSGPLNRWIAALGTRAYALFLVHFPVCLVVNGLFTAFAPPSPAAQLVGVVCALAASLVAARFFYAWVEAPVLALTKLGRTASRTVLQTA